MTLALNLGTTIPGIMKKIIKFIIALETLVFIIFGCTKENDPMSVIAEGYIIGHVQCDEVIDGQGTGKLTDHGYCIILENPTNNFHTFTLPKDLIDFPAELLKSHNINNGGPYFFTDSLQDDFKIWFKYHKPTRSEQVHFACLSTYGEPPFPWEKWPQIVIEEAARIED